jgi:hypothetical protein
MYHFLCEQLTEYGILWMFSSKQYLTNTSSHDKSGPSANSSTWNASFGLHFLQLSSVLLMSYDSD